MLTVTFTVAASDKTHRSWFPVAIGRRARTEQIAIGGTSAAGDLSAQGETLVRLTAGSHCWIAVGSDPTAEAGAGWELFEGMDLALAVESGDKVAVIEAAS